MNNRNIKPILIVKKNSTIPEDLFFEKIYFFNRFFELLIICFKNRNHLIYYSCQGLYLYGVIALICKNNKFFFDNYDQYTGVFNDVNFLKSFFEMKLIKKADLNISRGLELNHLNKKYKNIFFPDYLIKKNISIKKNKEKKLINICYIGKLKPSNLWNNKNDYDQNDDDVIKWFSRFTNINYHLFPSTNLDNNSINDYKKLCSKYPNIYFNENTNYKDMLVKISDFDYGIANFDIVTPSNKNLKNKLKYSMANKIFDYIQCGLGVIFSRHENNYSNFTYNFMKHYGFAIDIEVEKFQTDNLYDFLNNKKKSINFDNLELMDIKKNIVRLLKKIEY